MSVTLFESGLVITDQQANRLDDYCTVMWLPKYLDAHDGQYPSAWPAQAGHIELAEWAITTLATHRVLQWEREVAEQSVTVDPW